MSNIDMKLMIHDKQTGELHEVTDLAGWDLTRSPAKAALIIEIEETIQQVEAKRIA